MGVSSRSHLVMHTRHPLEKGDETRPEEIRTASGSKGYLLKCIVHFYKNLFCAFKMQIKEEKILPQPVFLFTWNYINMCVSVCVPIISGAVLLIYTINKSRHWDRYPDWLGFSLRGVALRRSLSTYITSLDGRHTCIAHHKKYVFITEKSMLWMWMEFFGQLYSTLPPIVISQKYQLNY